MRRLLAAISGLTVLLAGCSSPVVPEGVELADGWTAEVVRDDLESPTQLAQGPDQSLLVAELVGGEDDAEGRVSDIGVDGSGDRDVLAQGLLTPTGVGVVGDRVAVQEQRRLVELFGNGFRVITENLPFNGRSQGTLGAVRTVDGVAVVATVTGRGSGPDVDESGLLQVVQPADDEPVVTTIATGFKNAYAQAVDSRNGDLYVTEVGDGTYDGEAPPDELHRIPAGVWEGALYSGGPPYDGGWPRCTGDADPTEEFGATAEECEALQGPLALFPPRSTPTSVAVTPAGRVLVALWVENRVVEVDPDTGEVSDVATGFDRPQHLLAMPDGSLLLTVHGSGELVRLTPTD